MICIENLIKRFILSFFFHFWPLHSRRQLDFSVFRFNFQWKFFLRIFVFVINEHRIGKMGFHRFVAHVLIQCVGKRLNEYSNIDRWSKKKEIYCHWRLLGKELSWKIDIFHKLFFFCFCTFCSLSRKVDFVEQSNEWNEKLLFSFVLLLLSILWRVKYEATFYFFLLFSMFDWNHENLQNIETKKMYKNCFDFTLLSYHLVCELQS